MGITKDKEWLKPPIFVSHSHEDYALAAEISQALDTFGYAGFVAHKDLEGGVEWRESIIRKAGESVALVALLTNQFRASHWTDQEVGMAVLRGIPIIAISPERGGLTPYGFMAKYQAVPWKIAKWEKKKRVNTKRLARALTSQSLLPTERLFDALHSSRSLQATEHVVELLMERVDPRLGLDHLVIMQLVETIRNNWYVNNSTAAINELPKLLYWEWQRMPPLVRSDLARLGFNADDPRIARAVMGQREDQG